MESSGQRSPTTGRLLVFLGALVHILYTLLPDSSSWAVLYPWVMVWQAGLLNFVAVALLLMWHTRSPFFLLGSQLDWGIGLFFSSLCISTIFAKFPNQALWYSLIGFSWIAIAYVLNNHLNHRDSVDRLQRLLRFQASLSFAVVIECLALWIYATLIPEFQRLEALRGAGINLAYDFSNIQLRNWAPFGHPNYTAGFLILALPLFAAMAISLPKQRWLWIMAIVMALLELYTTSSRGGFMALVLLLLYLTTISIWRKIVPRLQVLLAGVSALGLVGVAIALNNRLQTLVMSLFSGGGELAFRQVMLETGWQMGLDRWLSGAGAGASFLMFQRYRPEWGAKISEWIFQLHSTPLQVWAELGIWGIFALLWTVFFTINLFVRLHSSPTWRSHRQHQIFSYALFGSLLAYGIFSLVDFQLDVFGLSAMVLILWISLVHIGQVHLGASQALWQFTGLRRSLAAIMTVFAIAAIVWLVPVNRAWHLSALGFRALANEQPQVFEANLTEAYNLTPWEPYYAYQLGFNLVDFGQRSGDARVLDRGLSWLEKGSKINPYQEYSFSAAAWINLQKRNFLKAESQFRNAVKLVPNRLDLNFGLAVSLLRQNNVLKNEEGLNLIAQQFSENPTFVTSPLWNTSQWQKIYPQILAKMKLKKSPILAWWISKTDAETKQAISILASEGGEAKILANALSSQNNQSSIKSNQQLAQLQNPSPLVLAIAAWNEPKQRKPLLTRAWAIATRNLPNADSEILVNALIERMRKSKTFDQWLRLPVSSDSPLWLRSRPIRQGFGVNSRHIDGGVPRDFWEIQSNALVVGFLNDLFGS
jgi:tetratricopeptide (TPR) repeat protein